MEQIENKNVTANTALIRRSLMELYSPMS